jgi:hypothetical protein
LTVAEAIRDLSITSTGVCVARLGPSGEPRGARRASAEATA